MSQLVFGKDGYEIRMSKIKDKRCVLYLGKKIEKSIAEIWKMHTTRIEMAIRGEIIFPPETLQWIKSVRGRHIEKLADYGYLDANQYDDCTISSLIERCRDRFSKKTDGTKKVHERVYTTMRRYFGANKNIKLITQLDAESYGDWIEEMYPSPATQELMWRGSKQMFAVAYKARLIDRNELDGLTYGKKNFTDKARDVYVDPEWIDKLLNACPNDEWRLIIVLCRYAGLRFFSEVFDVKWSQVDWEKNQLVDIASKKTKKTRPIRTMPIWPELVPYLKGCEADAKGEYLIHDERPNTLRKHQGSWDAQLEQIAKKAGVKLWPKRWQNMRSSAETDRVNAGFEQWKVARWFGHSKKVQESNYLKIKDSEYLDIK